jgi:uncharacterized membrane protein YgaE (UPF0421/DUF939 family)
LNKKYSENEEIIQKSKEKGIELLEKLSHKKTENKYKGQNATLEQLQNLANKRRTDVKKLKYAPGLRNFKEGRYEDVIKEFERKSAEKRGVK